MPTLSQDFGCHSSWWLVSTHLKNIISSKWVHLPQIFGVKMKTDLKPPPSYGLENDFPLQGSGRIFGRVSRLVGEVILLNQPTPPPKHNYPLKNRGLIRPYCGKPIQRLRNPGYVLQGVCWGEKVGCRLTSLNFTKKKQREKNNIYIYPNNQ